MGAIVTVNQMHPDEQVIERAVRVLEGRGVLVLPTDSVYGLACAATPENPAHARIFSLKRRDPAQTLPLFVADPGDLARFARDIPCWARTLAERFWPGALTLVVMATDDIPSEYCAPTGTVAPRCPDSVLVRELTRRAGPLAQTSANTHGAPAATSGKALEPAIVQGADLVLDAGEAPCGVASTIVDCTGGTPRILREGALSADELFSARS